MGVKSSIIRLLRLPAPSSALQRCAAVQRLLASRAAASAGSGVVADATPQAEQVEEPLFDRLDLIVILIGDKDALLLAYSSKRWRRFVAALLHRSTGQPLADRRLESIRRLAMARHRKGGFSRHEVDHAVAAGVSRRQIGYLLGPDELDDQGNARYPDNDTSSDGLCCSALREPREGLNQVLENRFHPQNVPKTLVSNHPYV